MAQNIYVAKITQASDGAGVEVEGPANDTFQAKKMIEAQYGPIKTWWRQPQKRDKKAQRNAG